MSPSLNQGRGRTDEAHDEAVTVALFPGNDMPSPIAFEQQQKLTLRGI
jgi:hypothetical protein